MRVFGITWAFSRATGSGWRASSCGRAPRALDTRRSDRPRSMWSQGAPRAIEPSATEGMAACPQPHACPIDRSPDCLGSSAQALIPASHASRATAPAPTATWSARRSDNYGYRFPSSPRQSTPIAACFPERLTARRKLSAGGSIGARSARRDFSRARHGGRRRSSFGCDGVPN